MLVIQRTFPESLLGVLCLLAFVGKDTRKSTTCVRLSGLQAEDRDEPQTARRKQQKVAMGSVRQKDRAGDADRGREPRVVGGRRGVRAGQEAGSARLAASAVSEHGDKDRCSLGVAVLVGCLPCLPPLPRHPAGPGCWGPFLSAIVPESCALPFGNSPT